MPNDLRIEPLTLYKNSHLRLSEVWLRNYFETEVKHLLLAWAPKLILITPLDASEAPQGQVAAACERFGLEVDQMQFEIEPLRTAQLSLTAKWLQKAGKEEGDILLAVRNLKDKSLIAIQIMTPTEILTPQVGKWFG